MIKAQIRFLAEVNFVKAWSNNANHTGTNTERIAISWILIIGVKNIKQKTITIVKLAVLRREKEVIYLPELATCELTRPCSFSKAAGA
jgi:hypothetical protein